MRIFLKEKFFHGLKHYVSNLILVWAAILFYRYNSYYSGFLRAETQASLFYLALLYTFIGFFFYIFLPIEKAPQSKGMTLFIAIKRVFRESAGYMRNFTKHTKHPLPKLEKHEKVDFLFVIVKIFFLPLMINFFFNNYFSIKSQIGNINSLSVLFSADSFNYLLYPFLLSSVFMIDTLYFSFGYAVESKLLNNKVKSVEPTILGWAVAIVCYPPFNGLFTDYASWYANDYAIFSTTTATFIARIFVVLFLLIYLSATIALGAKCSNLTNRGIVSRGPYKFIRHPAYISKNIAWWITIIPVFSIYSFLSMFAWSFIYYVRAVTEERHLIKDLDYQDYCRKVRYRFIPGVY